MKEKFGSGVRSGIAKQGFAFTRYLKSTPRYNQGMHKNL